MSEQNQESVIRGYNTDGTKRQPQPSPQQGEQEWTDTTVEKLCYGPDWLEEKRRIAAAHNAELERVRRELQ